LAADPAGADASAADKAAEPAGPDASSADLAGAPTAADTAAAEKAGEPTGADPPPHAARRRRAILAAVIGITAVLAIALLVLVKRPHAPRPAEPGSNHDGSAALRAPEGPQLPGAADSGVRLTGFVVDGAGLPVAGAEVSAELERGAPDRARARAASGGGAPASDAAVGDAAAGDAATGAAAVGDAGSPTVVIAPVTGADGRFVISGLVPGRFRLRVTGVGLLPAELRYVPVPSDEARIVVARQVAIEGTVTDGGKPVANASVGLRGDAIGGTIEMRTNATGGFRFASLPEGRYQLFAWQAALAARTVRVARLGAGPFGPVELRLEAAAIVVGRVIDRAEGTGLQAAIELRPSGDDQAPRMCSGDHAVFRIEACRAAWIAEATCPAISAWAASARASPRRSAAAARIVDGDATPGRRGARADRGLRTRSSCAGSAGAPPRRSR
jgi:hypothetical protein